MSPSPNDNHKQKIALKPIRIKDLKAKSIMKSKKSPPEKDTGNELKGTTTENDEDNQYKQKIKYLTKYNTHLMDKITRLEQRITEQDQEISSLKQELSRIKPQWKSSPNYGNRGIDRIICPLCQSKNIKSTSNKSEIITYVGHTPIYKSQWRCLECGHSWDK